MAHNLKLDHKGMHALLNCQGAAEACASLANIVAGRCGDGYAVSEPRHTGQRVAVNIYPGTEEASEDNMENDTLRAAVQSMEVLQ